MNLAWYYIVSLVILSQTVTAAPSITSHPTSQTVTAGQTATFSVTAAGTAPLSYQWRKNGTNISGATSASYTTPATTTADSGAQFTVLVSNSAGTATSNAASPHGHSRSDGAPRRLARRSLPARQRRSR